MVGTTSPPQIAGLTNFSASKLIISSINITGTNAADFAQKNNCGNSVPPQSKCTITVTFIPTVKGTRSAKVSISDDDPTSPQTVPLSGNGT